MVVFVFPAAPTRAARTGAALGTQESTCLTSLCVRNALAGQLTFGLQDRTKTTEILKQNICLYSIFIELKRYLIDAINPKYAFMCFVFPGMLTH